MITPARSQDLSLPMKGLLAWIGLSAGLVVTPLLLIGSTVHRDELDGPALSTLLWLNTVAGYGLTSLFYWRAGRNRRPVPRGER